MRRLIAAGTVAALCAGWAAMALPAQGSADTPANGVLVNNEVVLAQLDPTGLPIQAELVSRLSSRGGPERTVFDPTATANIEYLNRRGRPVVNGNGIDVDMGGSEPQIVLTKALVDKPMPVALHAEYALDGQVVDPAAIPGATGRLRVRYTVTNTDVEQQRITYTDATGKEYTEKQPIFAPLVGTLTVSLPDSFQAIDPKTSVPATDQQGDTILTWNLLLYPPLGNYQQTVAFEADVSPGSVPLTILNVVPVTAAQDPAVEFSDELLAQSVDGNKALASGLEQLDNQTMSLAQGAAELSNGIFALASGTGQVSTGVSSGLVPGAEAMASGAAGLAAGQSALSDALGAAAGGAGELANGSDALASGVAGLAQGLTTLTGTALVPLDDGARKLTEGADQLADAVGSPDDGPLPTPTPSIPLPPEPIPTPSGTPVFPTPSPSVSPSPAEPPTLVQAVNATLKGTTALRKELVTLNNDLLEVLAQLQAAQRSAGQVDTDATAAADALAPLYDDLCPPPGPLTQPQCDELASARDDTESAARQAADLTGDLTDITTAVTIDSLRAYGLAYGSNALVDALTLIQQGVDELALALRSGSTVPGEQGLVEALEELSAGLAETVTGAQELSSGADQASTGADQVAAANGQLADGLGQAASGSQQLATGSQQLAAGAGQLAFGTSEVATALAALATGADQAADGSEQLAEGAGMLQQKGTAKVLEGVVSSSDKPALANAWLQAANDRSSSALPYGLPKGATGSAAYVMTMAPVEQSNNTPWQAAALGLLLAATAGGAVLKQLQSHRRSG